MAKPKRHSATFKSPVVLELLKEEKMVTQIAAEYGIHPGQLHRWKRQALNNFPQLFAESQAIKQQAKAHEEQLTALLRRTALGDAGPRPLELAALVHAGTVPNSRSTVSWVFSLRK